MQPGGYASLRTFALDGAASYSGMPVASYNVVLWWPTSALHLGAVVSSFASGSSMRSDEGLLPSVIRGCV